MSASGTASVGATAVRSGAHALALVSVVSNAICVVLLTGVRERESRAPSGVVVLGARLASSVARVGGNCAGLWWLTKGSASLVILLECALPRTARR